MGLIESERWIGGEVGRMVKFNVPLVFFIEFRSFPRREPRSSDTVIEAFVSADGKFSPNFSRRLNGGKPRRGE